MADSTPSRVARRRQQGARIERWRRRSAPVGSGPGLRDTPPTGARGERPGGEGDRTNPFGTGPGLRGIPRSVLLLALTSFLADVSSEMLYPVVPLFLTQQLGAPASVVGLVEGVADGAQYADQGLSGWVADRMRRYKPLVLVGYTLAALAKPVIGLASGWPLVLVGRFVDRSATGLRSAPRDGLIAASVGRERRGAGFGLEGVGDNLGAVCGPLLAVALLYLLHLDMRWVFFLALVPGLLAVATIGLVPEYRDTEPDRSARPRPSLRQLDAGYWKYLLAVAAFGVGNSSNAFIILEAHRVGIPDQLTMLVYAGYNLAAALASLPAGALSDRLGRKGLWLGGLALFAVSYAGFAVSTSAVVVAGLFVLYGIYQGIFRSVGKALASDLAPADLRGSAVGLFATTVGLSSLVAGVVAGLLWSGVGPAATFFYGAGTAVIGALLLAALVPGGRAARAS